MRAAIVVGLLVLVGLSSSTAAEDKRFKIIVNPKNPVASIERDTLRNAFLKKKLRWSSGETIRPIDLSSKFTVREIFTRGVLKKTPAQLKTYWAQQIFSGKGVPPPEVDASNDVVRYVLSNPGAVGYVPADVDVHGAKVIEVK
jgi:ABC-type phosphate transport system substrate-binding protein